MGISTSPKLFFSSCSAGLGGVPQTGSYLMAEGQQESPPLPEGSGAAPVSPDPRGSKELERAVDEAAWQKTERFRESPAVPPGTGCRSHLWLGAVPHAGTGGRGAPLHGQGGCRAGSGRHGAVAAGLGTARLGSARCPAPPLRAAGRCGKAETPRGSPDAPVSVCSSRLSRFAGVRGEIKENGVPEKPRASSASSEETLLPCTLL